MSATTTWVMTCPVLGTSHIKPATLKHLESIAGNAPYAQGVFAFVGFDAPDVWDEYPDMKEVMVWLRANYGDEQTWVRFDADGDVIEDMGTYDADWMSCEPNVTTNKLLCAVAAAEAGAKGGAPKSPT